MLLRPNLLTQSVLRRVTTSPATQHALRGQHAQSSMQSNGTVSETASSSSGGSAGGSGLQTFFSTAKRAVLRGTVNESHPETVSQLMHLMSGINMEELGLDPDSVSDPFLGALKLHLRDSRIKYMRIYEDHALTFGLFCFPAGATIPLHNHPGMTVFSRLMFGRMRVSSYDWLVPPAEPITSGSGLATLVAHSLVEPSSGPMVLFPTSGGNLHEFIAETPCAVLDLLTPPYEPPERNCTYYRLQAPPMTWPVARPGGGKAAAGARLPAVGEVVELEVFDPPDSFEVVSGLYPGDPVS